MAGLGPTVKLTFAGDDKNLSATIKSVEAKTSGLAGKIQGLAKGMAIGALVGNAVPIIGGTIGALTALSGAALLIPGAALAGAAAMQTFEIATAGFGDAIGAGLSGDMKKFAEATKTMAPNMREAASAVVAFKPQIDALKQTVQDNFWSEFSGEITRVGNALLPVLHDGLAQVAQDLGGVAFYALTAMRTPFFTGAVGSILQSTAGFFSELADAAGNVLTGIVGIGQVGATYLPALGGWINGVALQFKDWVTSLEGQNQIKSWIDTGIQAFSDLFAIIGNVGSALGSIFTGLGGQIENPLGKIRELTAQFAQFAASSQGQAIFSAIGQAAQATGTMLGTVLISALKALIGVLYVLSPVITAVANVLTGWAPVLGPLVVGVYGLARAFQGVQAGLGVYNAAMDLAKSKTVIAVATTVAQWAVMAAGAMARAVVMAAAWVIAMGPIGWVIAGITALAALIYFNWDTISAYTVAAWTAISTAVSTAWTTIVTAVSTAFTAVITWLSALPGQVLSILLQLPMMAASALGTLAGVVWLAMTTTWNFLWNTLPAAIGAAVGWLAGLPGMVGGALASLGSTVMGIASSAWQSFASTTVSVASSVFSFVATIPGRVGSFLASLPGILVSVSVAAFNGFRNAAVAGANAVLAFIGTIPNRVRAFFAGAGTWLANAGSQIMQGLVNGIRNAAQAVLNYIYALGRQIASAFQAAVGIHSPSKVFAEFGVNIGQGLVVGMEKITPAAQGAATGMATDVTGAAQVALAGTAPVPASGGSSTGVAVTFTGNTSDALATVIMQMVRTGKIQIKAA